MSGKFAGYYFRHQKDGKTAAVISGCAEDSTFVQVITDRKSYQYHFPKEKPLPIQAGAAPDFTIADCYFSGRGIRLDLPGISGSIRYFRQTPVRSDIMGFFRYFPMECRHGIYSMRHTLQGALRIEGETYDFNQGTGYIECDSGRSFPQKYLWMQANDFPDESSFMLSIAKIPFCGLFFEGCICALLIDGMEYRLATYRGVKVHLSNEKIILTQGKLRLEITILSQGSGHSLSSPQKGKMSGRIYENNDAAIKIRLFSKERLIRELKSEHAGFEDYGYLHNI